MTLTVRTYPDPILKTVCTPVTTFGTELLPTVQSMVATMISQRGVGLAANQVGLTERMFVMEVEDSYQEFINPEILEQSEEVKSKEGCLSFPGVFASVTRYNKIKIRAKTFMGNDVEKELTGRDAICFQHEIDHLNGIVFLDYLGTVKRMLLDKKLQKLKK